jgi:hypothetical protein
MQLEFGGVEEHVERCPLFQIETAELLEAHDCKAGINGVQLGYLDQNKHALALANALQAAKGA